MDDVRRMDLEDLVNLALNDPSAAVAAADQALNGSPSESEAITALRARGLAHRHLGDFGASEGDLVEALDRADRFGDAELWAGAGLSLAGTRVFQGRVDEAKDLLNECIERATGESHIEAIYQLGTTYAQAGDLDAAVAHYERALPLIRELDRPTWEGNLLGNRGVMNIYRGSYDDAITDLDAAIELHADQGPSMFSLHRGNKAYALQLRGDIAEALDLYAENERFQHEHDLPSLMYPPRCTAYVAAGMYEEAMELAQRAHRFHTEGEAVLGAIEALLPGAEAALALGKLPLAQQLAGAAIGLDSNDAFPAFTIRAHLVNIESKLQTDTTELTDAAAAAELAAIVGNSDVAATAHALHVGAAVALAHHRHDKAAELLAKSADPTSRAPLHLGVERATLLASLDHADDAAVLNAVDEGLAIFDRLVAGVASYDVRYRAARHAAALADHGLGVLLRSDQLAAAVALAERVRAGALLLDARTVEVGIDPLRADESYLVWLENHDDVVCIEDSSGQQVRHDCGPRDLIAAACERQRFAHRQLAHRSRLSDDSHNHLIAAAEGADSELASLLVPSGLADRVILNPPASLAGVLWAALPGLTERAVAVAPSLAIARRPLPSMISNVAVLGTTELPHVPDEARRVAGCWNMTPALDPDPEILNSLAGLDILHAAGHFVADGANPLFSAVPLGNLRLRGNEYLQLDPPPKIAVLSACASGQGESVAGAHVGFSSAALAAGTTSIIATQTLIEDSSTTANTMTELHKALHRGESPAEALRSLRADASRADRSTVCAYVVIGAGW